jgi:tetratricopeptide (TPR) repeat protein
MVRFWQVPLPVQGPVEQIRAGVEVAGGMSLAPEGVTSYLKQPSKEARIKELTSGGQLASAEQIQSERHEASDAATAFDLSAREGYWHLDQALDSLETERWQAALWHLDRQLLIHPGDWFSHVLRSKANRQLDRLEQANADLAKAFDLGPAEQVLSWCRCFAAELADKEQWQAASWYLDRLMERRPKEAAPYIQRARISIKEDRWKEAAADYSRAVELSRGDSQLWLEKAEFDFSHGRWQDAGKAYTETLNLDPGDHWTWFQSSAVHLFIGDIAGYRRDCSEMVQRFGQTDDPQIAERIAKSCLLQPDAVEDQKLVQKLAELAVTKTEKNTYYPYFMLAKGMAEYRAGNPRIAINWLRKCMKLPSISQPPYKSLAQLFLAMSYHRLGQDKEARETLRQARTLIDAQLEKWKPEDAFKGNADWLRPMSVLREAEALINVPQSKVQDSKPTSSLQTRRR